MAINRFYIYKVPFRGAMTGSNPTDRSKLGTKRHILTDKKGIPLSVAISSASTHDIKLVIDVIDNAVVSRPSFKYKNRKRRIRLQQHLYVLIKDTILNKKKRN